jgi:outer membrane protein insertion porin family
MWYDWRSSYLDSWAYPYTYGYGRYSGLGCGDYGYGGYRGYYGSYGYGGYGGWGGWGWGYPSYYGRWW